MATTRSSTAWVVSPVAVTALASGAGRRSVIDSVSNGPPVICTSAIELMPTLRPIVGTFQRLPFSPDSG